MAEESGESVLKVKNWENEMAEGDRSPTAQGDKQQEPPEFLYKYSAIDKHHLERTERIFTHHEVYFASPANFNDPFDCRAEAIRIDSSDAGYQRYLETDFFPRQMPKLTPKEWKKMAEEWITRGTHREPDFTNQAYEEWQKGIDDCGIFCLSEKWGESLMWSHYSSGHAGYCLQFQLHYFSDNKESLPQPVEYFKEKPTIDYFWNPSNVELFEKVFLSKAYYWSYEKEWRVIDWPTKAGLRTFPPNLLTGLILGARMSKENQQWMLNHVGSARPDLKIYRAQTEKTGFGLTLEEISAE